MPALLDEGWYRECRPGRERRVREALLTQGKMARAMAVRKIFDEVGEKEKAAQGGNERKEKEVLTRLHNGFDRLERELLREMILEGRRLDGRAMDEIRPISIEVGLMSRAHGSVLFTRGETQALVLAALGSEDDEQMVDGLREEYSRKFMLDYNFPSFCVGETKPSRGPSRRDIGHGALAERSVVPVLPSRDTFPYTIRVLSEIMESNGSSSMASVCGATLSLMDAGVPIRNPVAGIAMGLVSENGRSVVLTDILGSEDHCGDMDFKVAGTQHGITGLQMDIKMEGLPWDVMEKALGQAREGRIQLLKIMLQAIDRPRKELKPHAPRFYRLQINPQKIGKLIGPGGKMIKEIQARTGAAIEVNDDGVVTIFCADLAKAKMAQDMVESLCQEAKIGQIYEGKIVSIKEFGAFIEILPGTEGLCHISELSRDFVRNVNDVAKMGDMIKVKVIAIDDMGRIKLSHKATTMEQPA